MQVTNDYSVTYLLIPTLLLSHIVLRATVSELPCGMLKQSANIYMHIG